MEGEIDQSLKASSLKMVKKSDWNRLLDACVMCRECGIYMFGLTYLESDKNHNCNPEEKGNFLKTLESYLEVNGLKLLKKEVSHERETKGV